jgi:subtilisin family serine protease
MMGSTGFVRRKSAAGATWAVWLAALFAVASVFSGEALAALKGSYVKGEALVLLKHDSTTQHEAGLGDASGVVLAYAQSVASRAGAKAVATYNALSASREGVLAFVRSNGGGRTDELLAKLRSDPNVISAAPNYLMYSSAMPNDARYGELWGMDKINAPDAWDVTSGGDGYFVAVLDTGIKPDHVDLAANFSAANSKNFTTGMFDIPPAPIVPDDNYQDRHGHGTHVSGTVGAVGNNGVGVAGVNWDTSVIAVKVLDVDPLTGRGSGTSSAIAAGLNHVVGLIDNKGVSVVSVNMSLGGWWQVTPQQMVERNDPLYVAFKLLSERTVVVVAAGNEGVAVGAPDNMGYYVYPASFINVPNKIVVGATDVSDNAAYFTNWSETAVDILAPGVNIASTVMGGEYGNNSGTSMAAPHVAGAVALLKSANPAWGPTDLKRIILETANGSVNPTTGPLYKPNDGKKISAKGLLDIGKAVDTVLTLSDLKVRGASVGGFNPWTLEYTVDVGGATSSTIEPTQAYPDLTSVAFTVNGSPATSPVTLQAGANTVEVKVKEVLNKQRIRH